MRVGVLALQGAFLEHANMLRRLGVQVREVRLPQDLEELDGLVIPGGESTTISQLMAEYSLYRPLRELALKNFPIFGTCAGMIILARKCSELASETLDTLDIEVKRNAFGRQLDSFETSLSIPSLGKESFPGVFIRAPLISKVGNGVSILCQLNGGLSVAVRQGKILAAAFHPELTDDLRFHDYFLRMIGE